MKYKKSDGGRKEAFPECKTREGDCVIRAIAIATQTSYKKVWREMFRIALISGNFPNSEEVSVQYLANKGWEETKLPRKPLIRINSTMMPQTNEWLICHIRHHWVALKEGVIYDIWDCRKNSVGDYQRVFRYYRKSNKLVTNKIPKWKLTLEKLRADLLG